MSTVLVTGGAGYIGSHTCLELLNDGWDVLVVDNLVNSRAIVLDRLCELTKRDVLLHQIDLLNETRLDEVFAAHHVDAVVHFAGLKAVDESVSRPLTYYENNVLGTLNLLKVMDRHAVRKLVFSSSCTVYGVPERLPVDEDAAVRPASPYGRTKAFIEEILRDIVLSKPGWGIVALRYFNPVGAHFSGRIGEDPMGTPNNLMPYVMQVAVGRRDRLTIHGDDYPTPDGTCVRDYIHVVDLARGHLAALERLDDMNGFVTVNLGTGQGYSVREVVQAASDVVGRPLPFTVGPRRAGDVPAIWADPGLAHRLLGWESALSLREMCADHWRWQSSNPYGYDRGPHNA